ncbi:MAG: hypothetical protein WCP79_13930 [Bacillota bacterium]
MPNMPCVMAVRLFCRHPVKRDLLLELVESLFMKSDSRLERAFAVALAKYGAAAKVIVMPYGGSTLPLMTSL